MVIVDDTKATATNKAEFKIDTTVSNGLTIDYKNCTNVKGVN